MYALIFTPEGRLEGLVTKSELITYLDEGKVTTKVFRQFDGAYIKLYVLTTKALARVDAGHALFEEQLA